MELNQPNECRVLAVMLKSRIPPCKDTCVAGRFPSYKDKQTKRAMGCWVAHTALTAIECLRLKPRLERALDRKGIPWERVEEASILHDVGKLSEAYVSGSYVQHNVLSAVVALSLCEDRVVPTAILLHHEAMHWKDLYRTPLSTTLRRLQEKIDMRPIVRGFSLHEGWMDAVKAVKTVLEELEIESAVSALKRILRNRKHRVAPGDINRCLRWGDHLRKALILYWILYLADNRAASARDGLRAYWLNSIMCLSEEELENPSRLADAILRRVKRPDVSLTAISEPRVMRCP